MTFVVSQKPTFTAPVVASIAGDGGRYQKVSFSVVFKALPKSEVEALLESIRANMRASAEAEKKGDIFTSRLTDRDLVDALMVGFGPDLLDEARQPLEFTPANVEFLCNIYPLEAAIVKSYFDNYIKGPEKN